jgi:hypothetical protein
MHFIQHDDAILAMGSEEELRIVKATHHRREVTIEVNGIGDHLGQGGFSHAPNPCQPYNGPLLPPSPEAMDPIWAVNHEI